MKFAGFVLSVAAVIFVTALSSQYAMYDVRVIFDGAVAVYFAIVLLAAALSSFGFKTLVSGVNGAISKKYLMTEEQRADAVSLFELLRTTVIYAAAVGVIASFMMLLLNLSDPAAMGPNAAVGLVSALYGAVVNMVLINPALHVLKHKSMAEPVYVTERIKDKEAVDKLLQLCFEKGLTREDIMNADEIDLRKFQ